MDAGAGAQGLTCLRQLRRLPRPLQRAIRLGYVGTRATGEAVDGATRVPAIKVELHGSYTRDACEADLRRMGFAQHVDPRYWACVEGLRP